MTYQDLCNVNVYTALNVCAEYAEPLARCGWHFLSDTLHGVRVTKPEISFEILIPFRPSDDNDKNIHLDIIENNKVK